MNAMIPDLYGPIHKAIRLALSDFLILAGSTDAGDVGEWANVETAWRKVERLLEAHSHHEDTHIHPLIRIAAPEIAATLDGQHEALDAAVGSLGAALTALAGHVDEAERRIAGRRFYLDFAIFLSGYFGHLIEEECRAMPLLVAHFPPATLFEARKAIVGSISPEDRLADLPLIARSLAPHERVALMVATRNSAPPAFFADAVRIMEEAIGPAAFRPVALALSKAA